MVFMDEAGIAEKVCHELSIRGYRPITVAKSSAFSQSDEDSFSINPERSEDYLKLFSLLKERLNGRLHLYHFFSLDEAETDVGDGLQAQDHPLLAAGFYSLLHLSSALASIGSVQQVTLAVISNRLHHVAAERPAACAKGAMLAACMVIPQEQPHVQCCSLDVVISGSPLQRIRLIQRLCNILTVDSRLPTAMALRGGDLWGRHYEPLPVSIDHKPASAIRKRGLYLITGGFGGIGRLLATHLVTQYQATLILVSRSLQDNAASEPSRQQWLQEMRATGANIEVIYSDVTDFQTMKSKVAAAEAKLGEINGVIHCAGLVGQAYLKPAASLSPQDCDEIFAAKIAGTQVLAALFEDKKPDFCLCMSSISCVLGGLGHAAYIAANLYMDYFVQRQNATADFRWLSVNWDGWQTAPEPVQREGLNVTQDKFAMSSEEGITAFERALAQNETDLLVHSTGDLDARIKQWITLDSLQDRVQTRFPRPLLDTPYVAPADSLQQTLCSIVQERLGMDSVGIHDNFFLLNVDSFIIVQITNMIKKHLNIEIPVVTFYKYPDVNALSAIIRQLGYQDTVDME